MFTWNKDRFEDTVAQSPRKRNDSTLEHQVIDLLKQSRIFRFLPNQIAKPVQLVPDIELKSSGYGLAGVLDQIDDNDRDRFNDLNNELRQWIPEYERIRLHTVANGHKSFCLRTCEGNHDIHATELSDGTLFILALLTIAYLPEPPPLICLEDPDHGIHPRLLRNVKDAIYRLAYPQAAGETRAPIQVLATTHSPYFLDLFKDHPEEIVIAEKQGLDVQFKSLSEDSHLREILQGASLGDVWYSGILGGVPSTP